MTKKAETTGAGPVRQGRPEPTALTAVSGLMEERRRYDSWLAALEARRDATPPKVFARVHADYTTRLEAVVAELVTHVEELRAELGRISSQLASIHDEQQHARDERAEAELRAHVGELTPAEWEATARAADQRIEALVARHAELETELQRTRELLTDAERPATPHLSSAAVPGAARVDPAVEARVSESVNAAAANPTPASIAAVGDSAEAAMHVPAGAPRRDREVPVSGDAAGARASADQPPEELPPAVIAAEAALADVDIKGGGATPADAKRGGSASFDELAFLHSVVDTAAAAPSAPAERAEPARPESPPPVRRESYAARPKDTGIENMDATAGKSILDRPTQKGTPLAANISGNNPIILKDKSAENAKTLKCADCGAMNYPTEWYCERCGAELASL